MTHFKIISAVAVVGILSGCAAAGASGAKAAQVEVDLYSGRVNPQATLSQSATDELVGIVREGKDDATAVEGDQTGDLGFRGFIVTLDDGTSATIVVRVVYDAIYLEDDTAITRIADDDGTAYRLVLDDIENELDTEAVTAIVEGEK